MHVYLSICVTTCEICEQSVIIITARVHVQESYEETRFTITISITSNDMAVEMRPMNQTFGDENLFDARSHYATGNDPNHNENGKILYTSACAYTYLVWCTYTDCK